MRLCIALLIGASLGESRFPITFKLCAYKLDGDNERFEKFGYENEEKMFLGQSRLDDSKFGWSGHGVSAEASEMLKATNFDWASLVTKVEYSGREVEGKNISWPLVQQLHGCTTFSPSDYFSMKEGGELFITVAKTYNMGLSVYIEDEGVSVGRALKSNSKAYTGAKMSMADLSKTWTKKFLLSVRQMVKRAGCVSYPTKQYDTYAQCDAAFLRDVCKTMNISPFWAVSDLSSVTKETSDLGKDLRLELWDLFDGSRKSDCGKPCMVTEVRGYELAEWPTSDRHSTFAFTLDSSSDA